MRAFLEDLLYWFNRTWGFSLLGLWPILVEVAEGEETRSRSLGAQLVAWLVAVLLFSCGVGAFWLARSPEASWPFRALFYILGVYFLVSGLVLAARLVRPRRRLG